MLFLGGGGSVWLVLYYQTVPKAHQGIAIDLVDWFAKLNAEFNGHISLPTGWPGQRGCVRLWLVPHVQLLLNHAANSPVYWLEADTFKGFIHATLREVNSIARHRGLFIALRNPWVILFFFF